MVRYGSFELKKCENRSVKKYCVDYDTKTNLII